MDVKKEIEQINSLKLDERINHVEKVILLAEYYLQNCHQEEKLSLEIINCIEGIRTSRFIESDIDMKLLDVSLKVARRGVSQKKILKSILVAMVYYSNYYPDKYNKLELEKEIAVI